MAHPIINTSVSSDTWRTWVNEHNQVCILISQNVVTASANSSGELTTGNVAVNGQIQANVIVAANLQGGTLGSPANLLITTNTTIVGNVAANNNLSVANNLSVTNQVSTANLLVGNSTVNGVANVYGNGSIVGTLTITNLVVTGNTTLTPNTAGQLVLKSSVTIFSTNGTYTKNANLVWADVIVVGPGGNGANVPSGSGTVDGAGGGGGGTAIKKIQNSSIHATELIIIGIGGTTTNSLFGNSTSIFANVAATYGVGATTAANATNVSQSDGVGGNGINGDINLFGQTGYPGVYLLNSGKGGDSFYGRGGAVKTSSSGPAGANGTGYGAAGSGAVTIGGGPFAGGGGANGVVIITEYYLG